jgi:hypothetical protein
MDIFVILCVGKEWLDGILVCGRKMMCGGETAQPGTNQ